VRSPYAPLLAALVSLVGHAAEPDFEALVAKLQAGDLEARQALIRAGIPAIGSLLAHAEAPDERFAAEVRSALRWIADRVEPARRAALCDALVPFTRPEKPTGIRRAAIDMLGRAAREDQVALLAGLLSDRKVQAHAAAAIARVPSRRATRALVRALRRAPPASRALLLGLLGSRGDPHAVSAIARHLNDKDEASAVAAARALGRIAAPEAERPLLRALSGASLNVRAAALDAYLDLGGARLHEGERDAAWAIFTSALACAANANEQIDALRGLGRVGSAACLTVIRPHLKASRPEVQRAAYTALCQIRGSAGTRAIAEALPKAPPALRPTLIRALGARRHRGARDALIAAAKDPNKAIAVAALAALGRRPDPAALPVVRMLAEQGATEGVRLAALKTYLKLGEPLLAQGKTKEARTLFERAYQLASRDAERIDALAGMAVAGGPPLLPKLFPLLKTAKGDVLDAVADACTAIADRLAASNRDQAIRVYKQIVEGKPPAHVARQMMRRLQGLGVHFDLAGRQGFVTSWWVIGPFDARNFKAAKKRRFPEEKVELKKAYKVGRQTLRWRRVHGDDPRGIFDLARHFHKRHNVLAYAYAELGSPTAREVCVRLARDDGLTVWLNGERIYDEMKPGPTAIDQSVVAGKLVKGINRILVKCANAGGNWNFCLRLTDPDNKPLPVDQMVKR